MASFEYFTTIQEPTSLLKCICLPFYIICDQIIVDQIVENFSLIHVLFLIDRAIEIKKSFEPYWCLEQIKENEVTHTQFY
jgi:hypothetical protein